MRKNLFSWRSYLRQMHGWSYGLAMLFLLLSAGLNAQAIATQTFTADGYDDDNFVLTILPSQITVNNGATIQKVEVQSFNPHYASPTGGTTGCSTYDWFAFDMSITGGVSDGFSVSEGCSSDINGADVTGFTNMTFTSQDTDDYSDHVYLEVILKVTYEGTFTPTYCTPTATSNDVTGLTNVTLKDSANADVINNDSSTSSTVAYVDYTSISGTVVPGDTYSLSAKVNTAGNYTVNTKAWFDWDNDGTFETEYNLGSAVNQTNGTTSLSPVSVPVPAGLAGGDYRMRVRAIYSGTPTSCGAQSYSEAEDYTIHVDGAPVVDGCDWTVHVWENYWGDDVEWELRDSSGTAILSGGAYGSTYNDIQTTTAEGPLTFWITNDGWSGDNEPNYEISNGDGVILSGQLHEPTTFESGDLNCSDAALVDCSGTPDGGTAMADPTSGPSGATSLFTVTGYTTGALGLTYDWEYSVNGGAWTSTGAAGDSVNFTITGNHGDEFAVRYVVTCTNSGETAYSNEVIYTIDNSNCTPSFSYTGDYIVNFQLEDIQNMGSGYDTGGYSDFTTMSTDLEADTAYTASLTSSSGSGNHAAAVWIDFDDDGFFDVSERVGTADGIGASATVDLNITIPADAALGAHRLRVVYQYGTSLLGTDILPCVSYTYGEGEDYTVNIISTTTPEPGDCDINSFPFTETFEDDSASRDCWSNEYVTGSLDWLYIAGSGVAVGTTTAHSGELNASFWHGDWLWDTTKLVSPKFDFTGLDNMEVNFYLYNGNWGGDQSELRIYYKTSQAGTWTLIPDAEYTTSIDSWTEETVSLPESAGASEYYLAFEGKNTYSHGIGVDDVIVREGDGGGDPEPGDYCTPALDCTDGDLISNVTFQEINNTTDCSPDGYGDYTDQIANVEAGQTYPISITVGDGWYEHAFVWIDLGNDGSFDETEDFFGEIGIGGVGVTVEGEITIPAGTSEGAHRMRILAYAGPEPDGPCINNLEDYGEYEDYTIQVGEGPDPGDGPCADKTIMECGETYTQELVPNSGEWTNYTDVTWNYTGSEKVWEFTAPTTGMYTFEVDAGTQDADFFLMDACSNSANNLLDNGLGYWTGDNANETITLTEGVTYYLIGDLYTSATSPTTVSVKVTCPGDEPEPGTGCLSDEWGQYPSTAYTPGCMGTAESITDGLGWFGEYSVVNVTAGTEYIFSTDVSTAFITIGNADGTEVLASGTASVTWTADATGPVRFYTHEDDQCTASQNWVDRMVQCGEVPPPPTACEDFKVLSNNLENGLFFEGDTAQHMAVDVPVADAGFTVYGMEPTVIGEASSFSFIIYEDAGGVPGAPIGNQIAGIIVGDPVHTGDNFGYPFYKYTVAFDAPVDFEANTTYWIEIISDAVAWESESVLTLGNDDVFYNTNVGEGAWTPTGGDEFVFNLVCEPLGVSDMSSFEFAYYPNPVKDVLNISSKKSVENVSVFNLAGQKVLSNAKVSNGQIDVNSLTPGTYVFRVTLEGGQVETFKIIKK